VQTLFDAVAEPTRRAILGLLAGRELSVGQLETRLELPQPLVSKHLRVLREAGFVEARTEAQMRVYRLRAEPLIALDKWLAPYRRFWTARLDALERHLDRMPDAGVGTRPLSAGKRQSAARRQAPSTPRMKGRSR
jgi:DNA-binding transcriptional ArsR family regulator